VLIRVASAFGCSRDLAQGQQLRRLVTLLQLWKSQGVAAVGDAFLRDPPQGRLQQELHWRVTEQPGPRLIVDGLWWTRPFGGVSRVWEQILGVWKLPGLIHGAAPITLIRRGDQFTPADGLPCVKGKPVNPLAHRDVLALADESAGLAQSWGAEVFLSSWTSICGARAPVCPELALVHDCMPERSQMEATHQELRRRWLLRAEAFVAVSAATAADLEGLCQLPSGSVSWCHPALPWCSAAGAGVATSDLPTPFVLLPGTGRIGSYKNPELLARALEHPDLADVSLLITGGEAALYGEALSSAFPHMRGRWRAQSCSDAELNELYRRALAVVMPSRIEGFGLPVVEALAVGGRVIVADSRGLREAGGGAALRCDADAPEQLAALLLLLLESTPNDELLTCLDQRRRRRVESLASGALAIALLAQARQLANRQSR